MSKVSQTKTEVIRTSTYGGLDDGYKSAISSRGGTSVSRTSTGPNFYRQSIGGGSSSVIQRSYNEMNFATLPGAFSNITTTGVSTVKAYREKEKKDMQDLNERFANYIEKVRFLEAQNKKLAGELDDLKSKWGKETSAIKDMYETELDEARKLIDSISKEKATLEVRISDYIDQLEKLQRELHEVRGYHTIDSEQIARQNQQLADLEGEIRMLRRSIDSLEKDKMRQNAVRAKMNDEIEKLRMDLNNETINHLDAENRRQTLEEELEFQKDLHAQELKELAALAYRDTTAENREFWKNELAQAIRDIQQEYDAKCDQMRGDIEAYYNLKVQEFRTGATKQNMEVARNREENVKLKSGMSDCRNRLADLEARNAQLERTNQDMLKELEEKEREHEMDITKHQEEITKLRFEMEGILKELQLLMDAKLSLELEIAAYRKLLEGEESRIGMKNIVEQVVGAQSQEGEILSSIFSKSDYNATGAGSTMRGEISAKTTYQRTSKGNVSIKEADPDGKFISVDSRKNIQIGGWAIHRSIDGEKPIIYTFSNRELVFGQLLKIWSSKCRNMATSSDDIVADDVESWGSGTNVVTTIVNDKREEQAKYTQNTLFN